MSGAVDSTLNTGAVPMAIQKLYVDRQVADFPQVSTICRHLDRPYQIVANPQEVYDRVSAGKDPVGKGKSRGRFVLSEKRGTEQGHPGQVYEEYNEIQDAHGMKILSFNAVPLHVIKVTVLRPYQQVRYIVPVPVHHRGRGGMTGKHPACDRPPVLEQYLSV